MNYWVYRIEMKRLRAAYESRTLTIDEYTRAVVLLKMKCGMAR
jgi:hypothetical protein